MKVLTLLAMCSLPVIAASEPSAVKNTNYTIGINASDAEYGVTAGLSGEARLPIAKRTGLSVAANLMKFNGEDNYIDSTSKSASLGLLFRKYDVGIIQAGYRYAESEHDSQIITSKHNSNSYSLSGSYYLKRFDLSVSRQATKPESSDALHTSEFGISYYPHDSFRLGASTFRMSADDSYYIFATYQPKLFNNATALSAGYLNSDAEETYSVAVAYFFDTRVSLLSRIRKY